jgi:hypothetical protein
MQACAGTLSRWGFCSRCALGARTMASRLLQTAAVAGGEPFQREKPGLIAPGGVSPAEALKGFSFQLSWPILARQAIRSLLHPSLIGEWRLI